MQQTKRGSRVRRSMTREQLGAHLRDVLDEALRGRRLDGSWQRVMTWKPPHVAADQAAAEVGATVAELHREPTNDVDPNAVQVVIDGRPVGYIGTWEAVHMQTAFDISPDPVMVLVRRARRKRSPLFDVFLPDNHPAAPLFCDVCKAESARSRDQLYGGLYRVGSEPAVAWARDGWKPI
ncbi:hypothetical protein [Microbacterium arborescens]|uniref:hypothetical protein n=1 Tax=Microbacterium arborescens TaxID=33883 RepID=UPI003C78049D